MAFHWRIGGMVGHIISGTRRLSEVELSSRAAMAASGFISLGIARGDSVILYLRNDLAFFEASFAASLAGAYSIPVNWHYARDEARYLFEDSSAKIIVIHADLYAGIHEAIPEGVIVLVVPTPPEVQAAYGISTRICGVPSGMTDWNAWLERQVPLVPAGTLPLGAMIYTSGTTGRPRAVTREPPTPSQAESWRCMANRCFGLGPDNDSAEHTVAVMTGPLYHSAPNVFGLAAARMGADIVLQPRFDAEELLRIIQEFGGTHVHAVPLMFNRMLKLPAEIRRQFDTSSLRRVTHGAAPCSPEVKRQMIEWWGPIIFEYYGSTETGLITLCNSEEWLSHPGSVGRAVPGVSLRVIDGSGNDLAPGRVGEVVCRNLDVANFTYRGDAEKRHSVERAGLVSLGDIGSMDADGYLYLCDRSADMIISGGVNIYPAEVEAVLLRIDGVSDCAVFGIPDEEFGEAVCAAIQRQPGAAIGEASIRAFLNDHIARYKIPKRMEFCKELPREDSGKIFKRKLREPYWAGKQRRI